MRPIVGVNASQDSRKGVHVVFILGLIYRYPYLYFIVPIALFVLLILASRFMKPGGRMRKTAIAFACAIPVLVAVGYAGMLALLYQYQGNYVFQPSGTVSDPASDLKWTYEDVLLEVGEDSTHGWYVNAAEKKRGALLFSHGNGGTISDRIDDVEVFRQLGFDVLAYDYGGYGKSTGVPSETRCQDDILAMWNYLVDDRGFAPASIILCGRSMGGGPTSELATHVDEGAVILESTFTSVPRMGAQQFPIFPAFLLSLLVEHRFDNVRKVGQIGSPLLVIHSPEDEIIPATHGQDLFDAAIEPKKLLRISGGHNSGYLTTARTDGLSAFLNPLFPVKAEGPEEEVKDIAERLPEK